MPNDMPEGVGYRSCVDLVDYAWIFLGVRFWRIFPSLGPAPNESLGKRSQGRGVKVKQDETTSVSINSISFKLCLNQTSNVTLKWNAMYWALVLCMYSLINAQLEATFFRSLVLATTDWLPQTHHRLKLKSKSKLKINFKFKLKLNH